jgi:hypothetical protein
MGLYGKVLVFRGMEDILYPNGKASVAGSIFPENGLVTVRGIVYII